jgi:hypothetical protein
VRQQIEAALKMREEAINKNDAAAVAALCSIHSRRGFWPATKPRHRLRHQTPATTPSAIDAASTQLVDDFAQQLVTPGSQLRTIVDQNITDKLTALEGHNPKLPVGPLAGALPGQIRNLAEALLARAQPELLEAIQTGVQARVNRGKAQLASQVANRLTSQLNRSFSFYDDWFDPVIGLRGRFNLNKAFYLTAESDVGGFGIGSDVAVQVYGALGCQIYATFMPRRVIGIFMNDFRDESANGFLIKYRCMAHRFSSG